MYSCDQTWMFSVFTLVLDHVDPAEISLIWSFALETFLIFVENSFAANNFLWNRDTFSKDQKWFESSM